jgi:hypothetical protein
LVKAYPEALTVPDPVSDPIRRINRGLLFMIINSDSSPEITVTKSAPHHRRVIAAFAEMNVVHRLLRTVRMWSPTTEAECEYKYEFEWYDTNGPLPPLLDIPAVQ